MRTHELSRKQDHRIALRAQLLDDTTHTHLLDVVWSLTVVQVEQTRTVGLFRSRYQLEIDRAAGERRWGYWQLPVLHQHRLGKIDATADRQVGVLRVDAVHEDVPFPPAIRSRVTDELHDLAGWLGLVARTGGR